jgi:hypothetical protein
MGGHAVWSFFNVVMVVVVVLAYRLDGLEVPHDALVGLQPLHHLRVPAVQLLLHPHQDTDTQRAKGEHNRATGEVEGEAPLLPSGSRQDQRQGG